jgi:hypothetical protein
MANKKPDSSAGAGRPDMAGGNKVEPTKRKPPPAGKAASHAGHGHKGKS